MVKKIKKESCIKYFIILAITLLFCQNFLQMHYSSDTYVLYDLGYMEYPENYFLLDGRLISSLVCYIAGILNIPMESYIIGMDFIGIVFIATAIYIIEEILKKLIKPKTIMQKIMLIAGCFILILNQFTLEYLLFPESAVMCLGVLLNVIATKVMIDSPKHKYLKIFILLLLATISYQGLLNMFPILAMMTYIVKQITDKREYSIKEKEFFIEMIKLAVIVIVVLMLSSMIVKLGLKLLDSDQDRSIHLIDLEAWLLRGETVVGYMNELWNNCMGMLPKHTNTITLIISFVLLLILKTKRQYIMQCILMIIVALVICIVPMFLFNTGICGRVNEPLMMIWGTLIIIILAQSSIVEEPKKNNIVYAFVIISFIVNNIFIMQNITEHIAANRVDENTGMTIKYAIERYEKETGYTVTKFAYVFDRKPQQYATGIKPIGSLTERKFACSWSVLQAMNFYCERKFEKIPIKMEVYAEKIINSEYYSKDYNGFSEEQLLFDGDTLYMIVY